MEELLLTRSALVRGLPAGEPAVDPHPPAARSPYATGEEGEPERAFVRALTRVLAFEHPALRATLLDVDDPASAVTELLGGSADTEIAWREGVRYAARLRVPGSAPNPAWRRYGPAGRT